MDQFLITTLNLLFALSFGVGAFFAIKVALILGDAGDKQLAKLEENLKTK